MQLLSEIRSCFGLRNQDQEQGPRPFDEREFFGPPLHPCCEGFAVRVGPTREELRGVLASQTRNWTAQKLLEQADGVQARVDVGLAAVDLCCLPFMCALSPLERCVLLVMDATCMLGHCATCEKTEQNERKWEHYCGAMLGDCCNLPKDFLFCLILYIYACSVVICDSKESYACSECSGRVKFYSPMMYDLSWEVLIREKFGRNSEEVVANQPGVVTPLLP